MSQPTPTSTDAAIKRDGRLILRLAKIFCKFDLPDGIDLRDDRPSLACGNHQSLLDVFSAAAFCEATGVSCRFLVNAKYFDNAIAGRWLRRIGCIPLNSKTKEAGFREARESLQRGELVGIMPEGRLIAPKDRVDDQVGAGRPGAAELAAETGAWLRPIVFHNTGFVWPRGKFPIPRPFRRPVVSMRLSELHIEPTDDPQADVDLVMAELSRMLEDLDAKNPVPVSKRSRKSVKG